MYNFLVLGVIPTWFESFYNIAQTAFIILIALFAIGIIIIIMAQESNAEGGNNVITGASESFYAANKGSTREGRLKKLIKILGILIAVLAVLYFVLDIIRNAF